MNIWNNCSYFLRYNINVIYSNSFRIQLLECGGNLYDAISIAVKAALWNTTVPHVKSASIDGKNIDLDVSEKLSECEKLDVSGAPLMVSNRLFNVKNLNE